MKVHPTLASVLLLPVIAVSADPSEKEIVALINSVNERINFGKAEALVDLTTLPGKYAVPALLLFFKQNYNSNGATPQQKAVGVKCAHLLTTTPDGEGTLLKLLKDANDSQPGATYYQQINATKCMAIVNNKFAVRVLCGDLKPTEMGGRAANALAMMNLPDAPFSLKQEARPSNAEGVDKWRQWWEAHKDKYIE